MNEGVIIVKETYEKRFLFCFFIYVILFIGAALFENNFGIRFNLITSFWNSNLFIPFIMNTVLLFYYIAKSIFE